MREDWIECELGELLILSNEKHKPSKMESIFYVGLEHIGKSTGSLTESVGIAEIKTLKNKFSKGQILYGKLRPYFNKVYLAKEDGVCSTDILVFSVDNNIEDKYTLYYMLSRQFVNDMSENTNGVNLPRVSTKYVTTYKFPLAPLPIQRAIVAKIETLFSDLDNGIANLKQAQAQLKIYRQAVLKKAFEGELTKAWREQHRKDAMPGVSKTMQTAEELLKSNNLCSDKLPKGWKWIKLQEVSEFITDGDHQAPPKSKSGIPFITISNINKATNKINFTNTFKVSEDYYYGLKEHRKPKKGDVLYTVTGSFGIPILIDFEKEFCFQRHIGLIRPLTLINQKCLYYILQTQAVYNQASETATGTAQKTVALSSLRNFNIPLCNSLAEQTQIVQEIESRLSVCDKMEQSITESLAKAEALRQSILKKAFEGNLLSQSEIEQCKTADDYEPASALLAKIKAEKEKAQRLASQQQKSTAKKKSKQ